MSRGWDAAAACCPCQTTDDLVVPGSESEAFGRSMLISATMPAAVSTTEAATQAGDEQARPALTPLEILDQRLHMGLRNMTGSAGLKRQAGGVSGAIAGVAVAVSMDPGTEVAEKASELLVRRQGAKPGEQ